MSDVSQAIHTFEDLLSGKCDFNGFKAGEMAIIDHRISQLNPALQPFVEVAREGFAAGASALVGVGETALGPIKKATSDTQATMLLNAMQAAGIPTIGPLSIAEHAALVTIINGMKAFLDKRHIDIMAPAVAAPVAQAA
jgi:hypothetical protein